MLINFQTILLPPILENFSIFGLSTYHVLIPSQECGEFTNWSICLIWSRLSLKATSEPQPGVPDWYRGRMERQGWGPHYQS